MNVTTIEQSKKLLKLGLKDETADMWYINGEGNPHIGNWNENQHDWDDIPAWSLSALLQLAPKTIKDDISECKLDLTPMEGKWSCAYVRCTNRHCAICNFYYEEPIDAVFEMFCWVLENKKDDQGARRKYQE